MGSLGSALAVFSRNALYKSTFYLLTFFTYTCTIDLLTSSGVGSNLQVGVQNAGAKHRPKIFLMCQRRVSRNACVATFLRCENNIGKYRNFIKI